MRHRILGELFELFAAVAAELGTLGLRRVVLVVEEEDRSRAACRGAPRSRPPRSSVTRLARPRTGPSVAGVHALGSASSGVARGRSRCTAARSKLQPRPNCPHDSTRALARPHVGEPIARPLVGRAQTGRAGEPGTDDVGEIGEGLHHPRATQALAADAVDHVPVDGLLGAERRSERHASASAAARRSPRTNPAEAPRQLPRWRIDHRLTSVTSMSDARLLLQRLDRRRRLEGGRRDVVEGDGLDRLLDLHAGDVDA